MVAIDNSHTFINLPADYPINPELSNTQLIHSTINCMDVNITIQNTNTLTFNIYDKKNYVSFSVINFTRFNRFYKNVYLQL